MDTAAVQLDGELNTFSRPLFTQINSRRKVIHRVMRQKRSDLTEIKCMEIQIVSSCISSPR